MTREEILNRVFHNSGVGMGGVDTVSPHSPSDIYPYSMSKPMQMDMGVQAPERVTPGQAEWFGHSGAGGGLGGLILPAIATALGGGLPDAAVNADALAVPQEMYAYNAASNAAQQTAAQAKAEEKKEINKIQAQQKNVTEMPASTPLELTQVQQNGETLNRLREQASQQLQKPDRIYLDEKTGEIAPDQIFMQDKDAQIAPVRDQLYLQDKNAQIAPVRDQLYLQDKNAQIAPMRGQTDVSVTGAYYNDKGVLEKFNRNIEGQGSTGKKLDDSPKEKSTLQKIGDSFVRYNDPERYLGVNMAAWGLAAPVLGSLAASAPAAAAGVADNVLQFPTQAAQAAQATKPIANNILQFPTQAAAGFGLSSLDRQMMQQAQPVQFPASTSALSGDYSAGSEWNPSTQQVSSKVNNKAMATNAKGLTSPTTNTSNTSSTTGSNTLTQNLVKSIQSSSLVKNLSNPLAGLKR